MAACQTPFSVRVQGSVMQTETIGVPCGKCPNCFKRRISAWSFRLMQQEKVSLRADFITLTYATEHVPITKKGFMNLNKRDPQLFMKRLRKLNKDVKLSYYLCGEYGSKTMRPHYHIILFNCDQTTIQTAWPLGQVHYGSVTEASVGYTLKYMSKPSRIPLHANDDRQKEFALMSKGLGADYMTPAMKFWHLNDAENRMYVNVDGNKKASMPRYYKDKIYGEDHRKIIGVKVRWKMEAELNKLIESDPLYFRNKSESDKVAFKLMAKEASSLNRSTV